MPDLIVPNLISNETWVEHPHGQIFARIWTPPSDTNHPAPDASIVLFHDSLGCVDLWRNSFDHSVGGGMAVNCAAQLATDCEALITIAAQAFTEDRTREGILIAKEQFKDDKQVERLKKYHGEKARWVLDAWIETWLHPEMIGQLCGSPSRVEIIAGAHHVPHREQPDMIVNLVSDFIGSVEQK